MDPRQALYSWFKSLPDRLQSEVALTVLSYAPWTVDGVSQLDSGARIFDAILAVEKGRADRFAAKLVCVRSLIDFLVIVPREEQRDWDHHVSQIVEFADAADIVGESELSEGAARLAESFREQSSTWIAAAARWREIEGSYLSDRMLRAWMLEELKA